MRGKHYGKQLGAATTPISYPMYRDFQDHNEGVFLECSCRFPQPVSMTYGGQAGGARWGELVSGTYFGVFGHRNGGWGARLVLRTNRVAGWTIRWWCWATTIGKQRFGGDPQIIGKTAAGEQLSDGRDRRVAAGVRRGSRSDPLRRFSFR